MKRLLSAARQALHPPVWVRILTAPVFAALIWLLATGRDGCAAAYAVYALSAWCLTILILPLPGLVRRVGMRARSRIGATALGARYLRERAFRTGVALGRGMCVSLACAAFHAFVGVRYGSVFFLCMAAYELALGGGRGYLLAGLRRRSPEREARRYRRTGLLLLLLSVPMGGMIVLMVLTDSGRTYPGSVIYLAALLTFCTMAHAAQSLVRFRASGRGAKRAAMVLNFVAAAWSVLGLQTAMIAQFSPQDGFFRSRMNAATGAAVWLITILSAACMLRRSGGKKEAKAREPV